MELTGPNVAQCRPLRSGRTLPPRGQLPRLKVRRRKSAFVMLPAPTPDNVELIVAEGQVTVLYSARDRPEKPAYLRLSNNRTSEDTTIDALEMAEVETMVTAGQPQVVGKSDAARLGALVFDLLQLVRTAVRERSAA